MVILNASCANRMLDDTYCQSGIVTGLGNNLGSLGEQKGSGITLNRELRMPPRESKELKAALSKASHEDHKGNTKDLCATFVSFV